MYPVLLLPVTSTFPVSVYMTNGCSTSSGPEEPMGCVPNAHMLGTLCTHGDIWKNVHAPSYSLILPPVLKQFRM